MQKIIDAHAHVFPDKIASKATDAIGDFYNIKMSNKAGTPELLLNEGKAAGISEFVVHSTATTVHQVKSINKYIVSEIETHPEFIGFMTLHPDMDEREIKDEIDYAIANGIKGIKLHPDFQHFAIDEPKAEKIYRAAEGRLPVLFHTGDKRYRYSNPERLQNVARKFEGLTVIGAHFGGYSEWEHVHGYKGLENVWFDTSSSLMFLDGKTAVDIIRELGTNRFFFGTDFPMWRPDEEIKRFLALPLTDEERDMIFHKNFEKVFR